MLTQLLPSSFSSLSLISPTRLPTYSAAHIPWAPTLHRPLLLPSPIRMGGGPRTYPGGVSKWQWKRMQAKKAKQLLKARLLRERQIYEMRKRAELKAAVSELEKPWELVEKAPTLLSVNADEQVKALADRFQKPGGFDMWSDRDGPQVLKKDGSILPTRRFFPKGVVHSVKPYGLVGNEESDENDEDEVGFDDWIARGGGGVSSRRRKDYSQDVRSNAHERKDDNSGIDIEARVMGENGHLGPRGNERIMGRSRQKVTLRPTSKLNIDDGSNKIRDPMQRKPRDGNGFGRNRGKSL